MRDIVFRGKRVDNGEWIYGSLLVDEAGNHYIGTYLKSSKCDSFVAGGGRQSGKTLNRFVGIGFALVDPETVGQDTGIRIFKDDPDGDTEITFVYEGDIIKDDRGKIYEVFFNQASCSFMGRSAAPNRHEKLNYRLGIAWCNTVEVIGNIHDNFELLEGESE